MKLLYLSFAVLIFFASCTENFVNPPNTGAVDEKSLSSKKINGASNDWAVTWTNNGNGHIQTWQVQTNDMIVPLGDVWAAGSVGKDYRFVLLVNPGGYADIIEYSGTSLWSNYGNHTIGPWYIQSGDVYTSLNYYIFAVNFNGGYAMLLKRNAYGSFSADFSNGGNGWIGGWHLDYRDRYLSGRFNPSNPSNEYCLALNYNSHWASLMSGVSWSSIWATSGGSIAGWNIQAGDNYIVNDFDGDGSDELLCMKSPWAALLKYNGSSWGMIWSNGGNGTILNWNIAGNDRFTSGNYNINNSNKELITINPNGYANLFGYYSGNWHQLWTNGGGGWIDTWHIGSYDYFGSIRNIYQNRVELFVLNTSWADMIRYVSAEVPLPPGSDKAF